MLTFLFLQALAMGCFGLATSNFQAMAMEPVGHIAGMASSVQGFISCVGGAALGITIGQQFDGSTVPLTAGFTLLGLCAFAIIFVVESGQLFRPLSAVRKGAAAAHAPE